MIQPNVEGPESTGRELWAVVLVMVHVALFVGVAWGGLLPGVLHTFWSNSIVDSAAIMIWLLVFIPCLIFCIRARSSYRLGLTVKVGGLVLMGAEVVALAAMYVLSH